MKIAFTSCMRHKAFPKQPEWEYIKEYDPDYLFLLGDTIYMDYGIKYISSDHNGSPEKLTLKAFEERMRSRYQKQFKEEHFRELVEHMRLKNGLYGIWDDHDFAWDGAWGADVCGDKLKASTDLFHEFLECSTNHPHVYYHLDTPMARVIFLDNRTYADKSGKKKDRILLGEDQFKFLEEKLEHNLPYTLVCSGLSLKSSFLGLGDDWSKFPSDLKRLCDLLNQKEKVIFLAGDIHKNKFSTPKFISKLNCTTPVELISSGMAINKAGLGIVLDDQHNWATLELLEDKVEVNFFKSNKQERRKSINATSYLNYKFYSL